MTKVNSDTLYTSKNTARNFIIHVSQSYLQEEVFNKRKNWEIDS